jgi:hypothetical protein
VALHGGASAVRAHGEAERRVLALRGVEAEPKTREGEKDGGMGACGSRGAELRRACYGGREKGTADSAFSLAGSGCGWCGEAKYIMVEAKARADGEGVKRCGRQWRGDACGSGELRCALLRLLLGRDETERRARGRSEAKRLVKGIAGATERHSAAGAGLGAGAFKRESARGDAARRGPSFGQWVGSGARGHEGRKRFFFLFSKVQQLKTPF